MTNKTVQALKYEESLGGSTVIMYAEGYYTFLDNEEGLYYVVFLEGESFLRFRKLLKESVSKKKIIPDDL